MGKLKIVRFHYLMSIKNVIMKESITEEGLCYNIMPSWMRFERQTFNVSFKRTNILHKNEVVTIVELSKKQDLTFKEARLNRLLFERHINF